jgi:MFS transporter, MHS family, shikimate and dehydroshikimate transport protein
MTLEHADGRQRGFAASVTNMGGPSGAVLATAVFGLFSLLPEEQFLSWGWRIPFLLSAALVALGLWIRLSIAESPLFRRAAAARAVAGTPQELPLVHVLRTGWRNVGLVAFGGSAAFLVQSLLGTFVVSYAISLGQERSTVLLAYTATALLHVFTIPAFAALSDRVGRRPVKIAGALLLAALAWPVTALVAIGSFWSLLLAFLLGNTLSQAAMYGPMAAFISEMFGTSARYTGASLGYQLATMIGGGFGPVIASVLLAAGGGHDLTPIAVLLAAAGLLGAAAVALTRETRWEDLADGDPAATPQIRPAIT